MASASIRIDQAANDIPTGVAGRSRDDLLTGQIVQLRNADDTGVRSWRWTIADRPDGSAAALSSPVDAAPTFTPDAEGSYLIQLVVNEGRTGEVDRRIAACRDELGLRVPAAGETSEANWLVDGVPNARGYQPEFELFRAALLDLHASVTNLGAEEVYSIDFTAIGSDTITDGTVRLDDLDWEARSTANTSAFALVSGVGIRITHANGVATEISDTDNAPLLTIAISDLIRDYDPTRSYLFLVDYAWNSTPNNDGERFSIGFQNGSEEPLPGAAARFRGATASFLTADGNRVGHEAESNNAITTIRAQDYRIMGVQLVDGKTIQTWQSNATPWPAVSALLPVATQRPADAEMAGEPSLNHPDMFFTMAIASPTNTATHSVHIRRLRILRMN